MITFHYEQLLRIVLPEVIVVVAALIVLAMDLLLLRNQRSIIRFSTAVTIAIAGCACATGFLLLRSAQASISDGMLVSTPLTHLVQVALLIFTVLTLFLTIDSRFTDHVGEYILLILLATAGMMFLVESQNILVIFISLELLSLSLYILTAFDKRSGRSAEAALKYFLFGGMSAAFLLFGFSLLYGLSNSISLTQIAASIPGPALNPLMGIALITTVIGFGFKVAAVPFHFWAPDVYEGAPLQSAAFIASASKVASVFIFFQVMVIGFAGAAGNISWPHYAPGWASVLAVIAGLSMVLGNLVAIVQSNVRRLLAYSAIAHAGYMLLAVASHSQQSLAALLYYVVTYATATLGAFGVVAIVEQQTGGSRVSDFNGLSRRSPLVSFCLLIFLLSLAGIPPLAGFFGKFYLFVSALAAMPGSSVMLSLVVIAIAMSAVSLYYYLKVLKSVYVASPPDKAEEIQVPVLSQAVIVILAGAVVLLGCAPDLLLQRILDAIHASGH